MKHFVLIPFAALSLSGCMSLPGHSNGTASARFGQTANVDGLRVTPLRLLEDSRCPRGVQCVWAGQVRISVSVRDGSGVDTRELTLGQPANVSRGQLELVEVRPERLADRQISLRDYRFTFHFMPRR
jgi:hypothetical protein